MRGNKNNKIAYQNLHAIPKKPPVVPTHRLSEMREVNVWGGDEEEVLARGV